VILEYRREVQCENCRGVIRLTGFNGIPVWSHVPDDEPGRHFPRTLCPDSDKHAVPVFEQLLSWYDESMLREMGIAVQDA
jgi:hypothetical protein